MCRLPVSDSDLRGRRILENPNPNLRAPGNPHFNPANWTLCSAENRV